MDNNLLKNKILLQNKDFYFCDTLDPILTHSGMIIPHKHIATPFDFTVQEWVCLKQILNGAKEYLDKFHPFGYNVGWNIGEAGGQTMEHVHLHVIARFKDEPYAGMGIRYYLKSKKNKRSSL